MSSDVPSWTEPAERDLLAKLAKEVPSGGLIVEIGSLYGGTTSVLALANPEAEVVAIDDFSWRPEGYPPVGADVLKRNMEGLDIKNVQVIASDSDKAMKSWLYPIDFCFIDGGHSFQYVSHDLENAARFAQVIALHDYNNPAWPDIKQAIDKFLDTSNKVWYLAEVVGTVAVLRRNPL